jgi:FkbM family methyltransferase
MAESWLRDPEAFVTTLYRVLLEREPDAEGLSRHVGALRASVMAPEALALAFTESAEYRRRHRNSTAEVRVARLDCEFVLPASSPLIAELLSDAGYEPWVLPYFLEHCRSGMTVLDIGASWGVFSLPAARKVAPLGSVFAVEVSPWNCQVLLKSIKASGINNIRMLPFGVSDHLGFELLPNQRFTNNNALDTGQDAAIDHIDDFTIVPVIPLDFIRGALRQVDILKMDIEGMEHRFCMGAMAFLREHRPLVFTEYSPRFQKIGSGVDGSALLGVFLELGYEIEILHRQRPRQRLEAAAHGAVIEQVETAWRRHVAEEAGTHLDLCLHPTRRET